jgi:hypothetical protein
LVTIPENPRPLTATSHSKNQASQANSVAKRHSAVKQRELAGENLLAEIEQTMKTLLKPQNERRLKILESVLGSKGVRSSINHY